MQYPRTAFELNTVFPDNEWRQGTSEQLADLFHRQNERLYGFRDDESPVDVTTVRLRATGRVPRVEFETLKAGPASKPAGERKVFHDGAWNTAAVYKRADLRSGTSIKGPAVVEQEDSTVWVLRGWTATTDAFGTMRINRVQR